MGVTTSPDKFTSAGGSYREKRLRRGSYKDSQSPTHNPSYATNPQTFRSQSTNQ